MMRNNSLECLAEKEIFNMKIKRTKTKIELHYNNVTYSLENPISNERFNKARKYLNELKEDCEKEKLFYRTKFLIECLNRANKKEGQIELFRNTRGTYSEKLDKQERRVIYFGPPFYLIARMPMETCNSIMKSIFPEK